MARPRRRRGPPSPSGPPGATPPARRDNSPLWGERHWAGHAAGGYHLHPGRRRGLPHLRDGTIACWGVNDLGQSTPPAGTSFTQVTAGGFHSCAVKSDGTVSCWGYDGYGQATPPAGTTF